MEKLKKILDSETNKWIVKKAKPQVFGIIIMSVIFGGMAYLGVAVATLSRGIVDSAVNSDVGGIVYFAIILISLTIAQLVIRIISKVLTFNVSSKLEISIKQDIFDNIIRKKYNEISSIHTGELLNRITSDVSVLVSSIISIVPNMVYFIVKLVGVFVVLFAIDKTFSLVFVFGGALMFVVVLLFKSKMKTLHKAVQESDGKTRSFFQEIFSSLLVVKVFGAENKVSENAMNLQQNLYLYSCHNRIFFYICPRIYVCFNLGCFCNQRPYHYIRCIDFYACACVANSRPCSWYQQYFAIILFCSCKCGATYGY